MTSKPVRSMASAISPRLHWGAAPLLVLTMLSPLAASLAGQPLRRTHQFQFTPVANPRPDSLTPIHCPRFSILDPRSFTSDPGSPSPDPRPPDRWFARDKVRHFGSSAAIQLMGYGILTIVGVHRTQALIGAALVTASAGIGKEVWDGQGHGTASARDLVWDGLGLVAGSGLVRIADPP